jgi:6-phosphogluconolactonase (cycloisomerase 2 family)
MKTALLLLAISLSVSAASQQNGFVYSNDGASPVNTVSAFRVNGDGSLTLIAGSPFATGGNGGSSDVNAGKIATATREGSSFLYAANNNDATISAFRITPATGALTPVHGSPFPSGAPNPFANFSLAASPDGKLLFATDEVTTAVHVFAIHEHSGGLTERPNSPFELGAFAEGLKVSPNGRFLVVGLKSIDAVGVFAIRDKGTLTAVPGSPFPASGAATAVEVDCDSDQVFASNAGLSVIDAYHMAENGRLTRVPGSPFPSGGTSTINALTLSPDNRFLFTSNLFNDSVSSLAVRANGSLQAVLGSPFPADDFVGAIAATRAGSFVYASLVAEAAVDGWSIGSGGVLTPVPGHPFFTGQPGFFVQSLTTFPAPKCRKHEEEEEHDHDD